MKTIGQLIKEELINLAINDKLPQDLNELDATIFDKIAMGESKQFPNGFTSWMETHYEVVSFINSFSENYNGTTDEETQIAKRLENFGIGGSYELAEEWTDAFELQYSAIDWGGDLDYFDEIDNFCKRKNFNDGSKL